jgi:hypothetical protein
MKKLTLGFFALIAIGSAAFAGTETYTKESKAVVPPQCPQWYADNEFNLSISGIYAFRNDEADDAFDTITGWDNGWGGAIDAKYFMHKYFGFGVQGFFLSVDRDNDNFARLDDEDANAGGILGTFTVRFPINCSRFAPYVWIGGGGIWNGDNDLSGIGVVGGGNGNVDDDSRAMGQVGGGFEIRFTPHFGWQNDFSWNVVDGSNNNFGIARTGLNFAF